MHLNEIKSVNQKPVGAPGLRPRLCCIQPITATFHFISNSSDAYVALLQYTSVFLASLATAVRDTK